MRKKNTTPVREPVPTRSTMIADHLLPEPDPNPDPQSEIRLDSDDGAAAEPKAEELDELADAVKDVGGDVGPDAAEIASEDEVLDAVTALAEDPDALAKMSPDDLAEFLALGFDMAAHRRGEHWKMTEGEKRRMALCLSKLVEKYGLEWLGKYLWEVMTVLMSYAVFARRFRTDAELAEARKRESGDAGNT